ncbi:MAG: hypothetical protein MR388_03985 [Tenericutes bacterium]|nr:hypothetical protein [Mycoplasmatota bacterium]
MRTIDSICQSLKIDKKENILCDVLPFHYQGIIKEETLLLKEIQKGNHYKLYVVYDGLLITAIFTSLQPLELMYTYLEKQHYSKILELSNMSEIIEFHIESL